MSKIFRSWTSRTSTKIWTPRLGTLPSTYPRSLPNTTTSTVLVFPVVARSKGEQAQHGSKLRHHTPLVLLGPPEEYLSPAMLVPRRVVDPCQARQRRHPKTVVRSLQGACWLPLAVERTSLLDMIPCFPLALTLFPDL
jgi:hypothetical protein